MTKDGHNGISIEDAILPVALTATTTGLTIDTAGYEAIEFVLSIGTATAGPDSSNYLTATLQEGDESDMSDASTVASADILGTAAVPDASGDDEQSYNFGYRGTKRYVRLVLTETGTFAAPVSAIAVLSETREVT